MYARARTRGVLIPSQSHVGTTAVLKHTRTRTQLRTIDLNNFSHAHALASALNVLMRAHRIENSIKALLLPRLRRSIAQRSRMDFLYLASLTQSFAYWDARARTRTDGRDTSQLGL